MQLNSSFFVPNICRNTAIFTILVVLASLSFCATLVVYQAGFVEKTGKIFLYLCWVIFPTLLIICSFREKLNKMSYWLGFSVTLSVILTSFILVEVLYQSMDVYFIGFDFTQLFFRSISFLIVAILVVFSFSFGLEIANSHKAHLDAKMKALQLCINPHFLFNTLNTIAELTSASPQKAEEAVENLALLFRVGLENEHGFHSLDRELGLCERYIMLEKLRLDDKLDFSLNVFVESPKDIFVPKLLIQPLLENSLVHGVTDNGHVQLEVEIKETNSILSFHIVNACGSADSNGMGVALNNIHERLFILFDDKFKFRKTVRDGYYSVFLSFPKWNEKDSINYLA